MSAFIQKDPRTISRVTGLPLVDVLEEMERAERSFRSGGALAHYHGHCPRCRTNLDKYAGKDDCPACSTGYVYREGA